VHSIPERTFGISSARRRISTFWHCAICSLRASASSFSARTAFNRIRPGRCFSTASRLFAGTPSKNGWISRAHSGSMRRIPLIISALCAVIIASEGKNCHNLRNRCGDDRIYSRITELAQI
jgi:hypothetical protein